MAKFKLKPYTVPSSKDQYPEAQQAVASWVDDAVSSRPTNQYYNAVPLTTLPSGKLLTSGTSEQTRQYIMAAVDQVKHWDNESSRHSTSKGAARQHDEVWPMIWGRRIQAFNVVESLLRRKNAFSREDLLELLKWCNSGKTLYSSHYPVSGISKALEHYASTNPIDSDLASEMTQICHTLKTLYDKQLKRYGTAIEQLIPRPASQKSEDSGPALPAPQPSPSGNPKILTDLKISLSILPEDNCSTTILEPDRFPLREDSFLTKEHTLVSEIMQAWVTNFRDFNFAKSKPGKKFAKLDSSSKGLVLLAVAERQVNVKLHPWNDYSQHDVYSARNRLEHLPEELGDDLDLERDQVFDYLLCFIYKQILLSPDVMEGLLSLVVPKKGKSLTEGERYTLSLLRTSQIASPLFDQVPAHIAVLNKLIQDGQRFFLQPGEYWSDELNSDLSKLSPDSQAAWIDLLKHLITANGSRPSDKWIKTAQDKIKKIGAVKVAKHLQNWLLLVPKERSTPGKPTATSGTMIDQNADALKGILWCLPLLPSKDDFVRPISTLAISAYRKIPGIGPRAVKVGNAAIYALSEIGTKDAVGQLAMLKVRVKFGTAQKEIEKAFNAAAEALGLPRDQIEELAVPSYGLEEVGRLVETLGDYRAEIDVTGSDASLNWFDSAGKALKSVPAKIKSEFKDELKDLQQSVKDIQSMLPAQRDRIDSLFLAQKTWPVAEWQARYLEHPLIGTIAQRLIWKIDGTPAFFIEGKPTDHRGKSIKHGKLAEISLWHPVDHSIDEIIAWRNRLEQLGITQPFKQAHREIYLLTDAERNTGIYSNRFAAHILRQHQFNALCAARGWKNKLRLCVDAEYPPAYRELPQWNLRAEFWVEGIGDNYGVDTNEAGVYLRLASDQVRFYAIQSEINSAHASGGSYTNTRYGRERGANDDPLTVNQIPPLVFSEIMRDVDLFVGVSSVGNDPTWQDGGPEGRFRDYWHKYSFGELSGTASTRKDVLQRLIPRLKIASRCSFSDRFLIVKGDRRTYKIHLGSGNILMEPNDQYLCIVPGRKAEPNQTTLFLPFEGDNTLSIIISKAFLLADDKNIKDSTINTQINR